MKFFEPQGPNPVFSETKLALCLTGTGDHAVALNTKCLMVLLWELSL